MKKYLITFAATGGLVVEAEDRDAAESIFNSDMQEDAGRELAANGIDITEIYELEEDE